MDWVSLDVREVSWGRDVVRKATNGCRVSCHVVLLPLADEGNEEVALELAVENLTEKVQVGYEGGLQNDGDI